MKISKIITVVLTLLSAIIIPLDYMIATKALTSVTSVASIINESKNIETQVVEVSTTELAKDDNNSRGTVTSRSGMRQPLADTVAPQIDTPKSEITEVAQAEEPTIEPVEEVVEEEIIEERPSFEGVELEYDAVYDISSSRLTKSKGVTYYNGHKETYYSQRVLPGKGLKALNNNGRHVADDGTVRDGDGYIAVACNYLPKGSEIMTSLGPGKVYDTGGMTGKWIDIYVNW